LQAGLGAPARFVSGAFYCAGISRMRCPGKVRIDNGWLLQDEAIEASTGFACNRLASYESASEGAALETFSVPAPGAIAVLAGARGSRGSAEIKGRRSCAIAALFALTAEGVFEP
jgi:hypothetical protein